MARFDIYGRFELELCYEQGRWVAYRRGTGLRRREAIEIPEGLTEVELTTFLDDVYHELAGPGQQIHRLS